MLLDTLHFKATDAGEHVLEAIRALQEINSKHSLTKADLTPSGHVDDVVTRVVETVILADR